MVWRLLLLGVLVLPLSGCCIILYLMEEPPPQQEKTTRPTSVPASKPAVTDSKPTSNKKLDPWDIAVMRSAQRMLEAERRLKKEIEAGGVRGVERYLSFPEISDWKYVDALRGMPAPVRKLDGQRFMMAGFMLPVEHLKQMKEFVLVQSLWACCYGQPPDTHQMVRVVLPERLRLDHHQEPVKVVGKLRITANLDDDYCLDIFQLHAESLEKVALPKLN